MIRSGRSLFQITHLFYGQNVHLHRDVSLPFRRHKLVEIFHRSKLCSLPKTSSDLAKRGRYSKESNHRLSSPQSSGSHPSPQTESADFDAHGSFGSLALGDLANRPVSHESLESRPPLVSDETSNIDDVDVDADLDSKRTAGLRKIRSDERPPRSFGLLFKYCKEGDAEQALSVFFDGILANDRVVPDRFVVHRLLDLLAQTGRSQDAFAVYRKMCEIGITPTQATYSRLFRACAEDSSVWYREHEHLLPFPSGPFRNPLQRRRKALLQRVLSSHELLEQFGGPSLTLAQNLWRKLHAKEVTLTRITYNTLMLALGRGGDLRGCLSVLDHMMSYASGSKEACGVAPDSFTLSAVLSAVKPSTIKRMLNAAVGDQHENKAVSLDEFELTLNLWHRIVPRMCRQLNSYNFVLLVNSIKKVYGDHNPKPIFLSHPSSGFVESLDATTTLVKENPPEVLSETPNQVHDSCLISNPLDAGSAVKAVGNFSTDSTPLLESKSLAGDSHHPFTPASVGTKVVQLNWNNPQLSLNSPVNLLIPTGREMMIVPPVDSWLPWHRLALLGGLYGFLEAVEKRFQTTVDIRLLTELVALLPVPDRTTVSEGQYDEWEEAVFKCASDRKMTVDIALYNALMDRRVTVGLNTNPIIQRAVHSGLIPDQITWGLMGRSCRTVASVKRLLHSLAEAGRSASPSCTTAKRLSIRPSLPFFASLLAASRFNWDMKAYILSLMSTPVSDSNRLVKKKGPEMEVDCEPVVPSRRMVADLEVDVALFRELLSKGVIPDDGSPLPATSETDGVAIPPHAKRDFHRFLRTYRRWLRGEYTETTE
ncbi:unnamed protein product [Calicophoron daubneyi]|uniref:Pentatricopeptide repeat-containing protein n=1 Tax=Calicophoron daubneyi TaxID=300641 RepID=A0AAV2TWD1_CALDB